jgi:cell division protein ZapB
MTKKTAPAIIDQQLGQLEEKVDSLLDIITRLMQENQSLRAQQVTQATERAGLVERHDEVRNRVEAIVSRLKSLETSI